MISSALAFHAGGKPRPPRLSILVPYLRSDPCALLERLKPMLASAGADIEVALLDDGGGDSDLNDRVTAALAALSGERRLLVQATNSGRAEARNRLAADARGGHVLLLDSDMLPQSPDYLDRYLALAANDAAAAFGGFTVEAGPVSAPLELHRSLQARGECLSASRRARRPEKYVYTSNLLVRRSLLLEEPFDPAFRGWGWEDVEWGLRIADKVSVQQIDNPARHAGLDTAEALLAKYEQSPANFARLLARHPAKASAFGSYRAARWLRAAPRRHAWRPLLRSLVLNMDAPLTLRRGAIKVYKAALYADVV